MTVAVKRRERVLPRAVFRVWDVVLVRIGAVIRKAMAAPGDMPLCSRARAMGRAAVAGREAAAPKRVSPMRSARFGSVEIHWGGRKISSRAAVRKPIRSQGAVRSTACPNPAWRTDHAGRAVLGDAEWS